MTQEEADQVAADLATALAAQIVTTTASVTASVTTSVTASVCGTVNTGAALRATRIDRILDNIQIDPAVRRLLDTELAYVTALGASTSTPAPTLATAAAPPISV